MRNKRKSHTWILSLFTLAILSGCVSAYQPTKSGLELQAFQKREFETSKEIAFKSVLTVFQDLGYTVESADYDSGFITAKSPTSQGLGFLALTAVMLDTRATAQIDDIRDNLTAIRLNFINRREETGGYGSKVEKSSPVDDPAIYENAFAKIREAIFIRTSVQ